jgi:hypothetical protein
MTSDTFEKAALEFDFPASLKHKLTIYEISGRKMKENDELKVIR